MHNSLGRASSPQVIESRPLPSDQVTVGFNNIRQPLKLFREQHVLDPQLMLSVCVIGASDPIDLRPGTAPRAWEAGPQHSLARKSIRNLNSKINTAIFSAIVLFGEPYPDNFAPVS